ncbi:MAG TPA: LutB/LldF family L-lactate oxidation iron-sulfur protein [Anaerolineales bacterium]|nr:LutB/LldF family L-lactate oxidation iron-sulfur protein [Anaerolineales bacterium]
MADVFRNRIRASLADENLQSALDANAVRRIRVRQEAFASLTNPEELRQRAHMVRADVINHLDSYLHQFISRVEENGIVVHQAQDAAQAIQQVLMIAENNAATRFAKAKTMVSEEIGLNHALERFGLEVVETDLGEYIVQLRGEPPSHIITPAVHLRRQDVGKLFQEKLGVPYTEDISVMTNLARQTLRQVFLNAEVGISGVNFGVIETGTLCLVTNEGNGRMVTTLPPVHIALMGIERLVPGMDDLALMLSLLPRSATGQKLSVYTSLLNRPRRLGEPDGPRERHLILVDNGRRAVLGSGLEEILYCIRCGACLNACPVFREIGGHAYVNQAGKSSPYSGPMGSVVSPALFGQLEYGHLARASSLCGACREACPVNIDLPKLLLRVRTGIQANPHQPRGKPNAPIGLALGLKLYTLAVASPWRFTIAQRLAGWFGSVTSLFSKGETWMHLPAWSGWGYSKDFPRPAARSFRSKYIKKNPIVARALVKVDEVKIPPTTIPEMDNQVFISSRPAKESFASELTAVGGHFYECKSVEVGRKILELLHQNNVERVLVWDGANLPSGLLEDLEESGIRIIHPTSETALESSKVRAGLTGAFVGIADTGSLVVLGGEGRPLAASLLTEMHIAVLREIDLVDHLSQVLNSEEVKQAPAAVVITGPSRTADIEMALTIGVHGPGDLHVFLLCEE